MKNDKSFASKIYFSITILMLIILFSALYSIFMINKTQEFAQKTAELWLPSIDFAQDIKYEVGQLRRRNLLIAIAPNQADFQENLAKLKDREAFIEAIGKKYEAVMTEEAEIKLYKEFKAEWEKYFLQSETLLSLVKQRKMIEAMNFWAKNIDPRLKDSQTVIEKIVKVNYDGSVRSANRGSNLTNITNITMLCIIGFSIFILLGIIQIVRTSTKTIVRSIDELKEQSISTHQIGETLKTSSQELSSTVANQASSVHETSAAVNEITSMINRTSENAKETLEVVRNASGQAKDGEKIMARLAQAMETIQESSSQLQNIAGIIAQINTKTTVINDIVSKTELLSLNASIESARAGEHGKGFAVVAEEVGNLAKVSGKSANEIQTLIHASQEQVNAIIEMTKTRVDEGKAVTTEAQEAFLKISENITRVTGVTNQISDATREQEIGIRQIATSMSNIDRSTQNSQRIVNSTAESAVVLVEQSNALDKTAKNVEVLIKGMKNIRAEEVTKLRRPPPPKTPPKKNMEPPKEPSPV